ncbi:MAG TPA: sugar transferase [Methylovirgula sp.]|nr:sugar transferase [Methylovirgula sp.]
MTVQDAQSAYRSELDGSARMIKRCFDIIASLVGIVLLLPLFAIIAAAIRIDTPGPVFFRQARVGRRGRLFRILKFRSMTATSSHLQAPLTTGRDPRITRVGSALRATKLDELPQLLNVLAGEMSLVGPRPELPELFVYYTPSEQAGFIEIRPGMTDYASLILRNESALLAGTADAVAFYRQHLMPMKHELCVRYLRELNIMTDLRIICATIVSLFSWRVAEHLLDENILRHASFLKTTTSRSGELGNGIQNSKPLQTL